MERWNPFRDNFDGMRQAMDRWMDDRTPNSWFGQQGNMLSVAIDVRETPQGYELEASLPGVKADDIDIQVDRDTITLRGQSQHQDEKRDAGNFVYRERRFGAFTRTIRLPEPINAEQVEATLDHGVLKVQLPRIGQTQQRRVQVRSGMQGSNVPMPGRVEMENNPSSLDRSNNSAPTGQTQRIENSSTRDWNHTGADTGVNPTQTGYSSSGSSNMGTKISPATGMNKTSSNPAMIPNSTVNNSSASGATGITGNLQTGSVNQPGTSWTNTETPSVGRGAPATEPAPGEVGPGASTGEHSQVDHRGQTGGQTYTSGGYRQSPQDTGTSSGTGDHGLTNSSAGQSSDNLSQSQTLGNQ